MIGQGVGLQQALQGGNGHVLAQEGLDIGGEAHAVGLGGLLQLVDGGVHVILHLVGKSEAGFLGRLAQNGNLLDILDGGRLQVLVPGHVAADAQHHLVRIGQLRGGQVGGGAQTHVGGVLAVAQVIVQAVVEVIHLGGGILFAAHGQGGGAALEHVGVPDQDHGGHQDKGGGDETVQPVGAALLGLLLSLTDFLGIGSAAGGQLLAEFLFS